MDKIPFRNLKKGFENYNSILGVNNYENNNTIKKILNSNFLFDLNKYKKILGINDEEYERGFINSKWIGKNLCGPSCVICYNILLKNNINNVKVYMSSLLSRELGYDHIFIVYNDKIYIDPTINQFLKDNIEDNIFIGSYDILKETVNKDTYNLYYWDKKEDITLKVKNFIRNSLDKK